MITEIDYTEQALSRVIQQYKDKENFNKVIELYAGIARDLELSQQDLYHLNNIDLMTGKNLDIIGEIVDQPRVLIDADELDFFGFDGAVGAQSFGDVNDSTIGGRFRDYYESTTGTVVVADAEYRILIRARIAKNFTACTHRETVEQIGFVLGIEDYSVDEKTMSLIIGVGQELTELQAFLLKEHDLIPRGAGISIENYIQYDAETGAFGFSNPDRSFFDKDNFIILDRNANLTPAPISVENLVFRASLTEINNTDKKMTLYKSKGHGDSAGIWIYLNENLQVVAESKTNSLVIKMTSINQVKSGDRIYASITNISDSEIRINNVPVDITNESTSNFLGKVPLKDSIVTIGGDVTFRSSFNSVYFNSIGSSLLLENRSELNVPDNLKLFFDLNIDLEAGIERTIASKADQTNTEYILSITAENKLRFICSSDGGLTNVKDYETLEPCLAVCNIEASFISGSIVLKIGGVAQSLVINNDFAMTSLFNSGAQINLGSYNSSNYFEGLIIRGSIYDNNVLQFDLNPALSGTIIDSSANEIKITNSNSVLQLPSELVSKYNYDGIMGSVTISSRDGLFMSGGLSGHETKTKGFSWVKYASFRDIDYIEYDKLVSLQQVTTLAIETSVRTNGTAFRVYSGVFNSTSGKKAIQIGLDDDSKFFVRISDSESLTTGVLTEYKTSESFDYLFRKYSVSITNLIPTLIVDGTPTTLNIDNVNITPYISPSNKNEGETRYLKVFEDSVNTFNINPNDFDNLNDNSSQQIEAEINGVDPDYFMTFNSLDYAEYNSSLNTTPVSELRIEAMFKNNNSAFKAFTGLYNSDSGVKAIQIGLDTDNRFFFRISDSQEFKGFQTTEYKSNKVIDNKFNEFKVTIVNSIPTLKINNISEVIQLDTINTPAYISPSVLNVGTTGYINVYEDDVLTFDFNIDKHRNLNDNSVNQTTALLSGSETNFETSGKFSKII